MHRWLVAHTRGEVQRRGSAVAPCLNPFRCRHDRLPMVTQVGTLNQGVRCERTPGFVFWLSEMRTPANANQET